MPITRSQAKRNSRNVSPLHFSYITTLLKPKRKRKVTSSFPLQDQSVANVKNVRVSDMSELNTSPESQLDNVHENISQATEDQDKNAHLLVSHNNEENEESVDNSGQVVTDSETTDPQNDNTDNSINQSHNSDEDNHSEDNHQQGLDNSSANTKTPLDQEELNKFKNAPSQEQINPQRHHIEQTHTNDSKGQNTNWPTKPTADPDIPEVVIKQSPHYIQLCDEFEALRLSAEHEIHTLRDQIQNFTRLQEIQVLRDSERNIAEQQPKIHPTIVNQASGIWYNDHTAPINQVNNANITQVATNAATEVENSTQQTSDNQFQMAQVVKFNPFSGSDDDDVVMWRKALTRNLKFLAWPQQRCTDLIPTLLTDKALKYYESLSTETQADLHTLLQSLEDKFSPTQSGTLYLNALQERSQSQHESVADYT